MKKLLSLATCIALCASFATNVQAANNIDKNEQAILDILNAGVKVGGKTVSLDAGYINQAETYFATTGVSITDDQANVVLAQIEAAKKVIVDNKITNLNTIDKKFQDQIIGYAQVAAKALGLTIKADYSSKTITVLDANGKEIFKAEKTIKNTGDNGSTTLALSAAIAILLAGAGIVATKKGLLAKK